MTARNITKILFRRVLFDVFGLGLFLGLFLSLSASFSTVFAANTYDLSNTNNFNLRIDGQAAFDHIPDNAIGVADLDDDGINDYIFGSIGSDYNGNHTGSLFIINGSILGSSGIGQTWDLGGSGKFSLRIDNTVTDSYFPYFLEVLDLNNDGLKDLLAINPSTTGAAYIIFNNKLTNYTGVGNTRKLTDSSTYSIKFSGHQINFASVGDFDGDSLPDIALGTSTNYQATNAGSVFIIFNNKFSTLTSGTTVSLTDSSNYDLRIDGSAAYDGFGGYIIHSVGDLDGDGKDDLGAATYGLGNGNGNFSGSLYLFSGNFLTDYKSSNSSITVANSTSYNIRMDGTAAPDFFAMTYFNSGDINADGKDDLIVGANNVNSARGAVYLFCGNSLTSKLNTLGNILEISQTSSYDTRFNGVNVNDNFGDYAIESKDMNNDGIDDLLLGASMGDKSGAGELYLIYGSNSYCNNIGSSIDMSDSGNYNVKYLGVSGSELGSIPGVSLQDVNFDGSYDILASAIFTGYNSRSQSGSLYTIYNFPHTLSLASVANYQKTSSVTLTGSVAASNSVTNIKGVQYSTDSNDPTGTWSSCTADDGTFNGKSENYSCALTGLTDRPHTVYIRAYDDNVSYTPSPHYASSTFTTDTTPPSQASFYLESPKDNLSITDTDKPTFRFHKATDDTSGISSYQIILDKGDGKGETTYLDNINPDPVSNNERIEENMNIKYSTFFLEVTAKNTSLKSYGLSNGSYIWKVRALDKAGNSKDAGPESFKMAVSSSSETSTETPPSPPSPSHISFLSPLKSLTNFLKLKEEKKEENPNPKPTTTEGGENNVEASTEPKATSKIPPWLIPSSLATLATFSLFFLLRRKGLR